LGQRAFVFGPNAVGKTNLLDSIRFLRDIAAPGGKLMPAVIERGGLNHIRSLNAPGDAKVGLQVEIQIDGDEQPWGYTLELSGSDTRKKPIRIEREIVRHGSRDLLRRPLPADRKEGLLTQTHLEQISQSVHFRPLADALASVEALHLDPLLVRALSRGEELAKRKAPGSDFIDQIARLPRRSQLRALRQIEKLLRVAVPQFSELAIERDDLGRAHLNARLEHWRGRGAWQNELDLSDGTLRLAGVTWAIASDGGPLLLDEPDLSLHPAIVRQLPRLFARATERSGRQVIISTHSEAILTDRGIDPEEILIVEPGAGGSTVVVGTQYAELVEAARARVPLERIASAITKPRNVERFSLEIGSDVQ
jgi:predicted ATPase